MDSGFKVLGFRVYGLGRALRWGSRAYTSLPRVLLGGSVRSGAL